MSQKYDDYGVDKFYLSSELSSLTSRIYSWGKIKICNFNSLST